MITHTQKKMLFILFYISTIFLVLLEVYLGYSMIEHGASLGKGITSFLTTGLLAGCGAIFKRMLENAFLKKDILPISRLHRLAANRTLAIEDAYKLGKSSQETRRSLVNTTLRFSEETLQGWVSGTHFELCVFVDKNQPLMFGYFDSKHETVSRSMKEREINPNYYIEKGYEVVNLLNNPTSQPKIIGNTHSANARYSFTTPQQRDQICSTILLCLDLTTPSVLVVSSNAKNAFAKPDDNLLSFLRFVGELLHYDLVEGGFSSNMSQIAAGDIPQFSSSLPKQSTSQTLISSPKISKRRPKNSIENHADRE